MRTCVPGGEDGPRCYPSSLSDAARAVLEPADAARDLRKGGAPRMYANRLALDAIFFVLRSGCQWRMIPRHLLPWDAAYRWYRAWVRDGTWDRIHEELRAQVRMAAAVLDAQPIKSSEGGEARGFDAGKKITSASGTWSPAPWAWSWSPRSQRPRCRTGPGQSILARLAARFPSVALAWADGGYANSIDNSMPGWAKDKLGLVLEIIGRNDAVKGFQVPPRRWVVERTFGWLARNRRLARGYERLTLTLRP